MTDTHRTLRAAAALAAAAMALAACEVRQIDADNMAEAESATPPLPVEAAPDKAASNSAAPAVPAEAEPAPAPEAPPALAAAAWSKSGYRLIGTEPFWGGTVSGSRILYKTPENQAGEPVGATAAFGPAKETYTGSLGGKPFVLTLTKGPCSDGMSDNVHAYTARLQILGEARQGCADPQ